MTIPRLRGSCLLLLALLACLSVLDPLTPARAQAGDTLLLVWAANKEADLKGYRIYECDGAGNLGTRVKELLVEEIPWADRIAGIASLEIPDVPPGRHCWAVTAFDVNVNESGPSAPACITLGTSSAPIHMADFYEEGFYGSYPGVEEPYEDSVVYTFDGRPGERLLTWRLWDINSPREVEILVNGYCLCWADTTVQYDLSSQQMARIPPEYLNETGLNTLSFEWTAEGASDMWAVGMVGIVDLIPLPAPGFYGNLANVPNGDTSHPWMAGFTFPGSRGTALVTYRVYDIDFKGEIEIFLNGKRVGEVTSVGNNAYLNPIPLLLPDDLVLDRGVNTLVFSNVLSPPYPLIWGVGNVSRP